jgi:AhpD family alkylhydroperoxidase
MMLDWNQYREQLLKTIGDLGRLSPQTVRGYRELSDAGTKTARLDAKTRELIALAVGVTRQCDGCITTHVHAARKQRSDGRRDRGIVGGGDCGQCWRRSGLLGSCDGRLQQEQSSGNEVSAQHGPSRP